MKKAFIVGVILLMGFQTKLIEGIVTGVQDGDTIEETIDGKVVLVRLNAIDCPEDGQGFSAKAKQYTTIHSLKQKVKLEKITIDIHGRMIANVFLSDGTSLNQKIVAAGYAWHYTQYSNDAKLAELEKQARTKKLGLWIEVNPVSPWVFKENKKKANK
jgi:endonuclease YncB( thermonuclease family)